MPRSVMGLHTLIVKKAGASHVSTIPLFGGTGLIGVVDGPQIVGEAQLILFADQKVCHEQNPGKKILT